tara:strand:- start:1297 stop:1899 length:603 start_codon:yes stop_codon:yes gene_type:complete
MNNYLFDNEINNKQNIDDFRIPEMSRNNRQTNNRNDYRFDNGVNNNQQRDVTMPQVSNNSRPINNSHDNYIFDRNAQVFYNQNQGNYHNPMNTRTITNNKPVQNNFQNEHTQNYFMSNFETINNGQEINMYQDRNPVDTRRDQLEKTRNSDRQDFLRNQGGNLNNFTKFQYENTRKEKKEVNISSYIPNSRTMAIPKENI